MARNRTARKINSLNASENATENRIDGLDVPVLTWGGDLEWRKVTVNHDTLSGFHQEKRDQYVKRSELCDRLQKAGEFEVAVAYAPSVEGACDTDTVQSGANKGKAKYQYAVKCSLCGSGHNWCVFYRSTEGEYLGHSGIPCFEEVLRNVHIDRSEAVLEEVKRNQRRAEKFARTMRRINDFKRDFPGLYEHRHVLADYNQNPYARMWRLIPRRLEDARGVDEDFLAQAEAGEFNWREGSEFNEATGRYEVKVNKTPERLPKFLKWASETMQGSQGDIEDLLEQIRATAARDEAAKVAAAEAKAAGADAPAQDDDTPLQVRAKVLEANGSGWLKCVKDAAKGETVTDAQAVFINGRYNALRAAQGDEKLNKALDTAIVETLQEEPKADEDTGSTGIECGEDY